jgi:hypothetical protein
METVLRRLEQGEAHIAQLHVWQKGEYAMSLKREIAEILSTAVKIGRENESAEKGNV